MKKWILMTVAALFLSGCATNPTTGEREMTDSGKILLESALRASTVRLIRTSTTVDAERVLEVVSEIRTRVDLDGNITADELMATADAVINFDVLLPEEREIIRGIMLLAQENIESQRIGAVTARAGEVLDWIERAARLQ